MKELKRYPVSKLVNQVGNNSKECIETTDIPQKDICMVPGPLNKIDEDFSRRAGLGDMGINMYCFGISPGHCLAVTNAAFLEVEFYLDII